MKITVILILVLLALRLVLIGSSEVSAEEAYYWVCGQRLDLAFFDGPAGVAVLVRLGELLIGDGAMGLRVAFPVAAAIASLGLAIWVSRLAGVGTAFASVLVLNVIPAFHGAAISVSPVAPVLAGIVWAGYFGWMAVQHPRDWVWWVLCGVALAVAVQFSYLGLLFLPGLVAGCLASRKSRSMAGGVGLGVVVVVVSLAMIPAILWNSANNWAPLAAAGTMRTSLTPRWSEIPKAILEAGVSMSPFLPIVFLALFGLALFRLARRRVVSPVVFFAAPFLVGAIYLLFLGVVSDGLLLASFGLLVPVLAAEERYPLVFRHGAGCAALVSAICLFGIAFNPGLVAQVLQIRSMDRAPWSEVATMVAHLQHEWQPDGDVRLFFITKDEASTAALTYHLHRTLPGAEIPDVFLRESQNLATQFGLWPRYDDFLEVETAPDAFFAELSAENPYVGRSALYLTDEEFGELPQAVTGAFSVVSPAAVLTLDEDSGSPKVLRLYFCADYQTLPL